MCYCKNNLNSSALIAATMTKTKTILGISFAAVFVFSMILIPAYAGGHVVIDKTDVKLKDLKISKVDIKLNAKIPKDGPSAFGYGIFTTDGLDNVLALATHPGLLDHPSQKDIDDPVFHAHVLDLTDPVGCVAGSAAKVDLVGSAANAGFEADYKVKVKDKKITVSKITPEEIGVGVTSIAAFLIGPGLCLTIISEQPTP